MKTLRLITVVSACAVLMGFHGAFASIGEIEKQEALLNAEAKKSDYAERLKRRYFLKEVELKVFHRRGLSDAQITIAAQLAEASGKMTYEIVDMRVEQKLTWAEISKRLNVHPQVLAQLLAQMRRSSGMNEVRPAHRSEPQSRQADRRVTYRRQG